MPHLEMVPASGINWCRERQAGVGTGSRSGL